MITVNTEQLAEMSARLAKISGGSMKATKTSIRRTALGLRTDMVRSATKKYIVKASDVRKTIKIHRVKASGDEVSADVISIGTKIPLYDFKVKPKTVQRKGRNNRKIAVQVKRDGNVAVLDSAFVIQGTKTGRYMVAERASRSRYPLRMLYGPAIPSMLKNQDIRDFLTESANERFEKNLAHEISRLARG